MLGQVKSQKLEYFGHVTRHNSLEKGFMLGIMPGTGRHGERRKQWVDNNAVDREGPGGLSPPGGRKRLVSTFRIRRRLHLYSGHGKLLLLILLCCVCQGFPMTVCPDAMLEVAKFAASHDRLFTMNLSAPFLCTAFKDQLLRLLPYVDILFGNELVSLLPFCVRLFHFLL